MQAGFKGEEVQVVGRFSDYARISDEADRKDHVFHFCPECGSQVFYTEPPELWWDSALPLYEAGKYAEAAARGH